MLWLKLVQLVSLWASSSLESDCFGSPVCPEHPKLRLTHSRCFTNACWMTDRRSDAILLTASFNKVSKRTGALLRGVCGPVKEHFRHEQKEAENREMVKE